MSPFKEDNVYSEGRQPPPATDRQSPNSSSGATQRASRVRHRGPSTSRNVKTRTGRHITNINRINVINNYGSWKKDQQKEQLSWCTLRVMLAVVLLFWFGAMATVMRNNAHQSTDSPPQSKAAINLSRWKKLSEHMKLRGKNIGKVVQSKEGAAKDADNQLLPKEAAAKEAHSIYELSMFGNKSPSDFQLYTPHAPSCSDPLDAQSVSYTLVSQLSEDRLWMVQHHCKRWGDNPMSVIIFTDKSADAVKARLVSEGCSTEHMTVQTVSKTKYDPTGKEYPVNLLRNLAFSAVKTSHIVYADVDFWPAADLYAILSDDAIKARLASDPKLATVIPVFQMYRRCKEYRDCVEQNVPVMPKTKDELLSLIKKKKASTFDPTNVGGHGSTKYITWRDQDTGTFVDLPCIKSNRYEPYLTIRYCSDLPPFQEGFTGYGKNKMTWAMQLRRSGYQFSQLGGAFLVHYPHLDSNARLEWNKKPKAMEKHHLSANELLENPEDHDIDWGSYKRARVDALFLDYKEWLAGTVEDEARVPLCEDALNDDVRLWVHSDKGNDDEAEEVDEEEEGEDSEDEAEESKDEYQDFLFAKTAYEKCQEEHASDLGECFKAGSDLIDYLVNWSLSGKQSGEVDANEQMEYLLKAEKVAQQYLAMHQDRDGKSDDVSFRIKVVELYLAMATIEKDRKETAKASAFIAKALELDPQHGDAQKMRMGLTGGGDASNVTEE